MNLIDRPGFGSELAPGERSLGPYAASAIPSRGREAPEPDCPTRSPFQRDRDRILHATPFRRLTYKTQVFIYHEGDHYRTRLTHSLEVAQIARTIARQLRLDEDLAEAIALAHDVGHSPFGHAGERALDDMMRDFGGFDHNAQSIRVLTRLERKYANFDGLNPTWETLEGLAKHNGPIDCGDWKKSAIAKVTKRLQDWSSLDLDGQASAEAQVAALSDDIAYINHDIDDGLRAGLLKFGDLDDVSLANYQSVLQSSPKLITDSPRAIYELNRRMITQMISDCVAESRRRLSALNPTSPDDIRAHSEPVVAFTDELARELQQIKEFLFANVYRHKRVMRVMTAAENVVCDLFSRYSSEPDELPSEWRSVARRLDDRRRARLIADFVAGMTDRLAISEHRRLFDVTPDLR